MEILNNFGIQPVLLLAQIVNFLIIFFLLKKFFFGPISKALEDRKKRIEESLKNSDLIEERLAKTEKHSAEIIEESRKNAQEIIDEAKTQAERINAEATQEARENIEQMMAEAKIQIASEREKMQKELEKETLTLVLEVTKKVLGRTLKPQERSNLSAKAASEINRKIQ